MNTLNEVTIPHQCRQLLAQHLRRGIGDDEVKAYVDVAGAFSLGVIRLQRVAQALALLLQAERHDEAIAAKRRGTSAGVEIICHDDTWPAGLRQMHMAVDPTRQHEATARINDFVGRTEVLPQSGDAAGADADIARNRIAGRNYAATAYDSVELCHACRPVTIPKVL